MPPHDPWPPLPLAEWEPTYLTLHRWTQIVGKIRLALAPRAHHWWHVPLYVTTAGLTTGPMRVEGGALSLSFDFCEHVLRAHHSDRRSARLRLQPMSVAEFHAGVVDLLAGFDLAVPIRTTPVEVVDRTPFERDVAHAAYDADAVERLHSILIASEAVFQAFRGRYDAKCSPVHFFWGAFDLAVTRFSGRANPDPPADPVMQEAYSHEVVSHGFWPGGDWPGKPRVEEPVYYAYAIPEPAGFAASRIAPPTASYSRELGEYLLPYDWVRRQASPEDALLAFLESTHAAAVDCGWGRAQPRAEPQRSSEPPSGNATFVH